MSTATDSTSVVVPSVAEVLKPPGNEVSATDGEPSPKKSKVEGAIETPVNKPGRRSRGSGGLSVAERTRREAEAIIKDLKEVPGDGRRTRSATRGTPAPSPVQVSPRAARKPREATPAVKSTTTSAEKKPASGGRGRGRGRPPRKQVAAVAAEEANDEVDADNGTETTSSDAPSATTNNNATNNAEPVPNENGIDEVDSPSDPWAAEAAAEKESKRAPVVEEKKEKEPEKVPSPSDPWAAESLAESEKKPTSEPPKPSDPITVG